MIVRDEEEHLGVCLASLAGIVDDVVVVDTGSVDDTIAIATRLGAWVYHHAWTDDFSAARNVALDHADGRWILYIDADERLRPIVRDRVVALLEHAEEVALPVWLRPFVGATPARVPPLAQRSADPVCGDDPREGDPRDSGRGRGRRPGIGLCDLELDHLGYERDQDRKHARTFRCSGPSSEPNRNVFNWHHLASVLTAMGETAEAEVALEERACSSSGRSRPRRLRRRRAFLCTPISSGCDVNKITEGEGCGTSSMRHRVCMPTPRSFSGSRSKVPSTRESGNPRSRHSITSTHWIPARLTTR